MSAKDLFVAELAEMGIKAADAGGSKVTFQYKVAAGRFAGAEITVGIEVPPDFSVTCPTGPHIKPRLIPINTSAPDNARAAESGPFGAEFEYLSRPFSENQLGWGRVVRGAKAYVRHVRRILETL